MRGVARSGTPLIHIPRNSSIYALGAANKRSKPLFETGDVDWKVQSEDAWALVGKGKGHIFQTLLGHTRISPPPPNGLYPTFKQLDVDPYSRCRFVSFRHSIRGGNSGEFYDYTARYGAMRDGDEKTLGESFGDILKEERTGGNPTSEKDFALLMDQLGLGELLGVPLVALSNGQMRRARIARAILRRPDILLLDEPLTGLDTLSRYRLTTLLQSFKTNSSTSFTPHVLSSFRLQEVVDLLHPDSFKDIAPRFITHIAYLENDRFWAGPRDEFFGDFVGRHLHTPLGGYDGQWKRKPAQGIPGDESTSTGVPAIRLVADLQGVSVIYQGQRKVLDDISWQISGGDRWHLQGSNGSGKTTLLSLITGDHPQSYVQKHLLLPSTRPNHDHSKGNMLKHRKRIPTPMLKSTIGMVSPELFDAFPRREPGMSVWDAVQTGFTGGFVPANQGVGNVSVDDVDDASLAAPTAEWRAKRCWEIIEALEPGAWSDIPISSTPSSHGPPRTTSRDFASRSLTSLTLGEQRLVLLMRALVGRPPLVILDELWSGMEEEMVLGVKRYLTGGEAFGEEQAVVVVTHWEEEVPWTKEDGLKTFRLEGGKGRIVE